MPCQHLCASSGLILEAWSLIDSWRTDEVNAKQISYFKVGQISPDLFMLCIRLDSLVFCTELSHE